MIESLESKTLALLYIAQALYSRTDSAHPLTQGELIQDLETHGISIERKTVGRHLEALRGMGFDVVTTPKGSWWNENSRTFSDGELRYLIDSVLFSKHLSTDDAEHLIRKLRDIGTASMQKNLTVTATAVARRSVDEEIFEIIDRVAQAIEKRKQIRFRYSQYDLKLRLVPTDDEIAVSPLRLVPHNGHYYLVAKQEGKTSFDFYRVERMSEVSVLDAASVEPIKIAEVDKYLLSHPYLSAGEPEPCEVLLSRFKLDDFVDTFGTDLFISEQNEMLLKINFRANVNDLYAWAMQNCVFIDVLQPASVRMRLRNVACVIRAKYTAKEQDKYENALAYARVDHALLLQNIDLRNYSAHKTLTDCRDVTLINVELSDVDFLRSFDDLRTVSIADTPISGLTALAGKEKLYKLMLSNTNVWDLRFLRNLPGLRFLCLIGNKEIRDYSVLYELPNLRYLVVDSSVELDRSRINAEVDVRDGGVYIGGPVLRLHSTKMLLNSLFKYMGGVPLEIPAVY
ncbi:MAG: WYL domain-containing protein, partial [Clostridia bacterium]|nr:WYL domain-containing protein [Clostridia bacterium]